MNLSFQSSGGPGLNEHATEVITKNNASKPIFAFNEKFNFAFTSRCGAESRIPGYRITDSSIQPISGKENCQLIDFYFIEEYFEKVWFSGKSCPVDANYNRVHSN